MTPHSYVAPPRLLDRAHATWECCGEEFRDKACTIFPRNIGARALTSDEFFSSFFPHWPQLHAMSSGESQDQDFKSGRVLLPRTAETRLFLHQPSLTVSPWPSAPTWIILTAHAAFRKGCHATMPGSSKIVICVLVHPIEYVSIATLGDEGQPSRLACSCSPLLLRLMNERQGTLELVNEGSVGRWNSPSMRKTGPKCTLPRLRYFILDTD